jgi:anti-sigma factor RsiW
MMDHNKIRQMLPLAAADCLSDAESIELQQHLRQCAACATELEQWQAMGSGLRALPTPQAPALLVERTQALMRQELASRAGQNSQNWLLAAGLAVTWALTLAAWPLVRTASGELLSWLNLGFDRTWFGLAAYVGIGWLTAGVAAVLLATQQRREREAA